ncbi:MAG: hypothetical protein PHR92_04205 [Lachnospiraceae bacterium]|nr:hypothetical protein [Lachnospiraceae bacterium]
MKKTITVYLLLCILLTLTACGGGKKQNEPKESTPPISDQTDTAVQIIDAAETDFQKNFHLAQEDAFNRGCMSEAGYYFVGNGYVSYVEKDTLRAVILCGKPECLHQDQTCNAYLGNVQHITFYEGRLYYAAAQEQGGFGSGDWSLYAMNADGTQKQKVQSLRSPNDGFISLPTQFLIHNGLVLFKSNRENILCAPLGADLAAADMVKVNDLEPNEDAALANLELWYLWADGETFYCFGNPKADQFRNALYAYRPQIKELTQVWKVPDSAETGTWDTSDVSVNGWYLGDGILFYFLSGNGLYAFDIAREETTKITDVTQSERTGTAVFDGEYAYINNEENDMLFVYGLTGEYLGAYDYSETVSQGVGQESGSGVAKIIGSDDKLVFLCAQNLSGMSQDGISLGYSFYYLPKADLRTGAGSFQKIELPK